MLTEVSLHYLVKILCNLTVLFRWLTSTWTCWWNGELGMKCQQSTVSTRSSIQSWYQEVTSQSVDGRSKLTCSRMITSWCLYISACIGAWRYVASCCCQTCCTVYFFIRCFRVIVNLNMTTTTWPSSPTARFRSAFPAQQHTVYPITWSNANKCHYFVHYTLAKFLLWE